VETRPRGWGGGGGGGGGGDGGGTWERWIDTEGSPKERSARGGSVRYKESLPINGNTRYLLSLQRPESGRPHDKKRGGGERLK